MGESLDPAQITQWLAVRAAELGFGALGVARLDLQQDLAHLKSWIADGLHGAMDWMARDPELRAEPRRLRPATASVICVLMDYATEPPARSWRRAAEADRAYIARYALGRDYHKTMRRRLLALARDLAARIGPFGYRVFADSAPILEKALARNAGLGRIGKNTLLLRRDRGSMFLLGELFTDLALPPTDAGGAEDLCGPCRACIRICPTGAILGPGRLDARRCISYLTIEHRGPIPEALRPAIGNRIFGCDDCQLVCPWNRYARLTEVPDFAPRHGLEGPDLVALFAWDERTWLVRTEGMALRRAGYTGWLRNLAVALGNAPTSDRVVAALRARAEDPEPLVREHVRWALARHGAV